MTKTMVRFKAKLLRPAENKKGDFWTFLILPKNASAKLPSRGMTAIEGTINGFHFQAMLEPDGQKSHWLKVDRKLREAAGADAGDVVTLEIAPAAEEPEPTVPADLKKALAGAPKARALWSDITPIARRDWIHWITSAKQSETRARRIKNACSMLAAGKRRVCCFDRSGVYTNDLRHELFIFRDTARRCLGRGDDSLLIINHAMVLITRTRVASPLAHQRRVRIAFAHFLHDRMSQKHPSIKH